MDQANSIKIWLIDHNGWRWYYYNNLGLNDIPCLQEAGIGISINAKSELNINAANKGNLFIKINLTWAFLYNIIIMPIVAGVFYHWNIFITPIYSSIAMSASSVLIVSFSHLLSCFHYDDSLL